MKKSKLDIVKIKKKYNGIIPIGKVNIQTWLKHDIRNKRNKAIALYRYGKTREFICEVLGFTLKDLSIIIDSTYEDKIIRKKKPTPTLRSPENYSNWINGIVNGWRKVNI